MYKNNTFYVDCITVNFGLIIFKINCSYCFYTFSKVNQISSARKVMYNILISRKLHVEGGKKCNIFN